MNVETMFSENDRIYTISVDGEFSFTLLHEFRNAYSSKEAESANKIIIDMRKTSTIDSSALGMLLNMQVYLNKADGEIKIINCNKIISNIFTITNFGKKFSVE
ncbi:MAG: STAS domain-containing protein [Gammaproteobacteria bacterium]|nr:STAS domain-containing protein [Gammaproteobacteria bacterium]